jgi:hypothetical protein
MKESTMNRKVLLRTAIALGAVLLTLGPRMALADEVVNISVDTSSLPVTPASEVFFILTDGSGLTPADGNNTATLSGFGLGGGLAGAVDTFKSVGGFAPSSNLGSAVSLTDSSFLNLFGQFFTPGSSLSFTLDLTTNVDAPAPDQFSFYILDPTGSPLATSDPFGNLVTINLDSPSPTPNVYSTLVTVTPAAVTPEPGTLTLLVLGLAGMVPMFRRRSCLGAGR